MATGNKREVLAVSCPVNQYGYNEGEKRVREVLYKEELRCKGAENRGIVGRIFGVKYR